MYNHSEIEKKWQEYWDKNKTFKTENNTSKPKFYCLDMFPYPSGSGLHVGHPEGYTANDILARYKHAKGFNVLHPMGWDAFGLPAENYAIKTGTHPKITTQNNINTFKRQIKELGFSYDWDREIDTTDPEYFKWTQWIFLKMFEEGLAYEQDLPINYCPSCKTGLANEEVLNDFSCERCGEQVEKKKIRQWVLAITKYAERLLKDVDRLDWPESIKEMQRNWIGKSEGCEFDLEVINDSENNLGKISVYTTRVDTVFGMTYAVLAPDHPEVNKFISDNQKEACLEYIEKSSKQSDQDRTADDKEKTGVFTGSYAINPYNGQQVPLWIGDYVLGNYGTGAVMAVPAHDERDFEFAKKYSLDIKQSIAPYVEYEGKSKTRDGIETLKRKTVDLIIENQKGEFLIQIEDDGGHKHIHFVGGGIEDGHSEVETVGKELIEETGYTQYEIISKVPLSCKGGIGYRHTKNKNQETFGYAFHVKITGEERVKCEVDEGKHEVKWVEKEEVKDLITWGNHSDWWDLFINGEKAITEYGVLVESGDFDGLTSEEAKIKLTEKAEKEGFGKKKINYKLRDWLFSRQRYWGEPIPLIHLDMEDYSNLKEINDLNMAREEDKAYILNLNHFLDEDDEGKEQFLVLNQKIFGKLYDGLYGKIVCDYELPLKLPEVENFEPAGDGNSPLAKVDDFVNLELATNLKAKRETNTMPQWGGSCWYYLRFMDAKNPDELVSSEAANYWGEVDSYVGGAEHAVLHLLYARFWHKFLFDIGVVPTDEPFGRLRNQGLILAYSYQNEKGKLIANDLVEEKDGKYFNTENGEELKQVVAKMSKSLKNVVNPDDIIKEYGADTLRLYEMYMADFKDSAPWDTKNIIGVKRFLDKAETIISGEGKVSKEDDNFTTKLIHKTIKKVGEDIENYKFNTAIAQMMILINNGLPKDSESQVEWKSVFVRLLHPFAPHLAEELWERINPPSPLVKGEQESVFFSPWPEYDEKMTIDDTIKIGVQVMGKLRGEIEISKDEEKDSVLEKAKNHPDVIKWLEGKNLVKEVYVPGRIVSLVVK